MTVAGCTTTPQHTSISCGMSQGTGEAVNLITSMNSHQLAISSPSLEPHLDLEQLLVGLPAQRIWARLGARPASAAHTDAKGSLRLVSRALRQCVDNHLVTSVQWRMSNPPPQTCNNEKSTPNHQADGTAKQSAKPCQSSLQTRTSGHPEGHGRSCVALAFPALQRLVVQHSGDMRHHLLIRNEVFCSVGRPVLDQTLLCDALERCRPDGRPVLARMDLLQISFQRCSHLDSRVMAALPAHALLRTLSLQQSQPYFYDMHHLGRCRQLRRITLDACLPLPASFQGWRTAFLKGDNYLGDLKDLPNLTSLSLKLMPVHWPLIAHLTRLRTLEIEHCAGGTEKVPEATDDGLVAFHAVSTLVGLTALRIAQRPDYYRNKWLVRSEPLRLPAASNAALAVLSGLVNLKVLEVPYVDLNSQGSGALRGMSCLRRLLLGGVATPGPTDEPACLPAGCEVSCGGDKLLKYRPLCWLTGGSKGVQYKLRPHTRCHLSPDTGFDSDC